MAGEEGGSDLVSNVIQPLVCVRVVRVLGGDISKVMHFTGVQLALSLSKCLENEINISTPF